MTMENDLNGNRPDVQNNCSHKGTWVIKVSKTSKENKGGGR